MIMQTKKRNVLEEAKRTALESFTSLTIHMHGEQLSSKKRTAHSHQIHTHGEQLSSKKRTAHFTPNTHAWGATFQQKTHHSLTSRQNTLMQRQDPTPLEQSATPQHTLHAKEVALKWRYTQLVPPASLLVSFITAAQGGQNTHSRCWFSPTALFHLHAQQKDTHTLQDTQQRAERASQEDSKGRREGVWGEKANRGKATPCILHREGGQLQQIRGESREQQRKEREPRAAERGERAESSRERGKTQRQQHKERTEEESTAVREARAARRAWAQHSNSSKQPEAARDRAKDGQLTPYR